MQRYLPHLSWAALGGALALLVSAVLTYKLSGMPVPSGTGGAIALPSQAVPTPFQPEKNLFGALLEPEVAPAASAAAPVAPPARLLVVGVMHGAGATSSAIIRNLEFDSVAVFRQGAWIFGRTEYLSRVEPDGVILAGGYGRRRLKVGVLPEEQGGLIEAARPTAAAPTPAGGIDVSRAEINASVRSPEELIGASKLVPEIRDGRIAGVKITTVADGSILKKMGLESSDVIKAINGQVLDSLERSTQAWEAAKKATEIHMLVERGGQDRTMSYYVRP